MWTYNGSKHHNLKKVFLIQFSLNLYQICQDYLTFTELASCTISGVPDQNIQSSVFKKHPYSLTLPSGNLLYSISIILYFPSINIISRYHFIVISYYHFIIILYYHLVVQL